MKARPATSWWWSRLKAVAWRCWSTSLLGQHQVVVKNLESNYRKVPNVSGATILGDGSVALILDTGALVRRTRH